MEHCYKNPDNPQMTHGNIVWAVRDHDAEQLPERQRWPQAVTEGELCNYVEGMYLGAMHDGFKQHPERKKMEVRCESKAEADYLRQLINRRCADPTNRFEVTYPLDELVQRGRTPQQGASYILQSDPIDFARFSQLSKMMNAPLLPGETEEQRARDVWENFKESGQLEYRNGTYYLSEAVREEWYRELQLKASPAAVAEPKASAPKQHLSANTWACIVSFTLVFLGLVGYASASPRDLPILSNLSAIAALLGLVVIIGFRNDKPWYLWPYGTALRVIWLAIRILMVVLYSCVAFILFEFALLMVVLTMLLATFPRDIFRAAGGVLEAAFKPEPKPFW